VDKRMGGFVSLLFDVGAKEEFQAGSNTQPFSTCLNAFYYQDLANNQLYF